jgi:crotonobetainyl-CoA:carnitine CoA-transferase CaiB-like acyl-CoA transferase
MHEARLCHHPGATAALALPAWRKMTLNTESESSARGILAGVRVLDFGRYVAGPYCATLLGYLGAEVIRVERREGGEDRYIAPVTPQGEGAVFLQCSPNKRSVTLDPTTPQGREVVHRLVATADIVVANLPAAALRQFGLDYATLCTVKQDIILVTQSAFGDGGPYATRGGFDGVGQAMSGSMYITGTPGHPVKGAAPYVDYTTASLSAFGALAALLEKRQTGRGQHVQAALLSTALAVFNSHLVEQGVTGINRVGTGNRVQTSAPSDVFATSDGHVLMHTVGNGLFKRWAKLMAKDGDDPARWTEDPLFQSDQSRGDHAEPILERTRQWCAARTTAEAVAQLEAFGLPGGPVYTPQQALDDPQVAAMGFLRAVDYPGLPRPAPVADIPLKFSHSPVGIRTSPPTLGADTDDVLKELGYDSAAIAGLREDGVV